MLANDLALFVQKYGRKAQRGLEPNDRGHSREAERQLKQLKPEQLSELLTAEEGQVPTPPRTGRKQPDPRFVGQVKRKGRGR